MDFEIDCSLAFLTSGNVFSKVHTLTVKPIFKVFELKYFPNLRHLTLTGDLDGRIELFVLTEICPKLNSLTLQAVITSFDSQQIGCFQNLTAFHATQLRLTEEFISYLSRFLPSSLQQLYIQGYGNAMDQFYSTAVDIILKSFRNITTVGFRPDHLVCR